MLPKLQKKFSTQRHAFKLYTSLSVLFIILQIECILSVHKQISIFNVDLTISGIIYPFNLLILGIITNSYGYQYARQLLWLNNLALIQFIIYNFIIFHLNPSLAMQIHQPDLVQSYNILVPLYIKSSISSMVSENIANFIFIWMINISKILQHGKKIGWRIMKYSVLANFIMLIIAYSVIFFNRYTVLHILKLIIDVMLIKTAIELFFLYFAVYCARKLREYEGVEVFDYSKNNPFTLLVNYEYLNILENLKETNESNSNK